MLRSTAVTAGLKTYFTGKPCRHGHVCERKTKTRACVECFRNKQKNWRKANKTKITNYEKEWRLANLARLAARRAERHVKLRLAAYARINPKLCCACCGEDTVEFLTIDHKNGDGHAHRRELGSKSSLVVYRWVMKTPVRTVRKMLRLLCANCNHAHAAYGYCPHKQEQK